MIVNLPLFVDMVLGVSYRRNPFPSFTYLKVHGMVWFIRSFVCSVGLGRVG